MAAGVDDGDAVIPATADPPDRTAVPSDRARSGGSPLVPRILGVGAAAVLGIGTFSALGLAIAQVLYDRGAIGHAGFEELEALNYLAAGVIVGAVIGVVASVWVGLRVWQGRWTLLLILLGVAAVTGAAIALTTA